MLTGQRKRKLSVKSEEQKLPQPANLRVSVRKDIGNNTGSKICLAGTQRRKRPLDHSRRGGDNKETRFRGIISLTKKIRGSKFSRKRW